MKSAATVMASSWMDRSESGQQFLIPRPKENSWGKGRALDKEGMIPEFIEFLPIMNLCQDEEYMSTFLDKVIVNGVQDPGLTPFEEFLPRSAPLVDFLSIGMHSGAGWKYPSADTNHGIQKNRGLSYQMLGDVEVKEIVAGVSSPEEILEIRIQTELLNLLRNLPVCVGLGVKGDMHKIEQFYTEVSGNGWVY